MATQFSALLLAKPWAPELFTTNLDTGDASEPPPELWDRAAAALNPSPEQSLLFELLQRWWDDTAEALTRERRQLAAAALGAPRDRGLQEAVVEGLQRVQSAYLVLVTAICAVVLCALLTPEQLAEVYLAAWPHMASMSGLFAAVLKLRPPA